jgi:hypothetical protein
MLENILESPFKLASDLPAAKSSVSSPNKAAALFNFSGSMLNDFSPPFLKVPKLRPWNYSGY